MGWSCSDIGIDDNHKPEMTIAVTPFDGLCGFRPLAEITHFLNTVPSLRHLVGDDVAREFEQTVKGHETSTSEDHLAANKKALQKAFSVLMSAEQTAIGSAAKDLVAAAKAEGNDFASSGGPTNGGQELASLIVRLNDQFEGDVGLFVVFFVNYVKLDVGEALFLRADDIHAYLSGGVCLQS
jgi:mannose-6-phosphate isomerase